MFFSYILVFMSVSVSVYIYVWCCWNIWTLLLTFVSKKSFSSWIRTGYTTDSFIFVVSYNNTEIKDKTNSSEEVCVCLVHCVFVLKHTNLLLSSPAVVAADCLPPLWASPADSVVSLPGQGKLGPGIQSASHWDDHTHSFPTLLSLGYFPNQT